ncbi:putative transposase, IS91 family protein [Marinobacter sp. ELB17]|nr:putative transposase, IS91 family protein [Marinobacter sp. ELB17]
MFRAKFLTRMREQGFTLPESIPGHWVAQCEQVGRGDQALTYLARYLYRGVLREQTSWITTVSKSPSATRTVRPGAGRP